MQKSREVSKTKERKARRNKGTAKLAIRIFLAAGEISTMMTPTQKNGSTAAANRAAPKTFANPVVKLCAAPVVEDDDPEGVLEVPLEVPLDEVPPDEDPGVAELPEAELVGLVVPVVGMVAPMEVQAPPAAGAVAAAFKGRKNSLPAEVSCTTADSEAVKMDDDLSVGPANGVVVLV
jgi:hypothetical protein